MKKIKQLANNAFVRPDRTEVLSEGLLEAERRIDQIRCTCDTLAKKIGAILQGHQSKDGESRIDKRIRKVPEYLLGSAMNESGKALGEGSVLGDVLGDSSQIEMKLGQAVVEFEVKIEDGILKPLQTLLEVDLPNIYKLKRQLSKYTEGMDSAKAKYAAASRHSLSSTQGGKIDNFKDELEEAQTKVEQCRDNLTAEMYALIARESEISRWVVNLLNYQKDYHHSTWVILGELIPGVESSIASSAHKPVYGTILLAHLQTTQRSIAYPIELCVCGLLITALDEEGLFRMAGSASKVKKLKSAFDAGAIDLTSLLENDPHVIANALKCYLRELPEPLLTFDLYPDWMSAIKLSDSDERLKALWCAVQKLPRVNYENLRYLVKFLKVLSAHQDVNKMSSANIAIVIAPNLLWTNSSPEEVGGGDNSQMGLNMTMTHHYSSLLDQLLTYTDYFFPDEIDFYVSCTKPSEQQVNGSLSEDAGEESSHSHLKRSQSNSSVDEQSPPQGSPKPVLRRKNKPAPVPPIQQQNKNPLANPSPSGNKVSPIPLTSTAPSGQGLQSTSSFNRGSGSSSVVRSSGGGALPGKEKRDGIPNLANIIPPSPREVTRKKVGGQESAEPGVIGGMMGPPPAKPPPPNLSQSSPLRHKSSFKATNSIEKEAGSVAPSIPINASAFSSLPRHFHTENSYKNQRAPRPPSMFGIPPPAPPEVTPILPISMPMPSDLNQAPLPLTLGFEKIELDMRKESISSLSTSTTSEDESQSVLVAAANLPTNKVILKEESKAKEEECILRPVPAPRSSLLIQSHNTGGGVIGLNAGEVLPRERPSVMAKPRDLSRRSQFVGDNKGIPTGVGETKEDQPSQSNQEWEEENNLDLSKNNGGPNNKLSLTEENKPSNNPHRPPRPHPPAPTKLRGTLQESTDL